MRAERWCGPPSQRENPSVTAFHDRFSDAVAEAIPRIPSTISPWSCGWCAAAASIIEAAAAKPGNVHPAASFDDLEFDDFVAAGIAIASSMDAAAYRPLGATILGAARAAADATSSNANLGIILLVAPLASVPSTSKPLTAAAVDAELARLDATDAAAIWQAIQLARPGGLGTSNRHDLAGPPPDTIREAMLVAADRDTIASLWAHGFEPLFSGPVADLAADVATNVPLETAIIRTHLRQLARRPDTLIARRHGEQVAEDVSARAAAVVACEGTDGWPQAVVSFDSSLRSPRRLNPGTTADLVAAAIYILLRDGRLRLPFLSG